jgi:hypothetical protein
VTGEVPLVEPGDVLAVQTPGGPKTAQWWIRFGAALRGEPDLSNHIAVVHHWDTHGTLWVIEGRPGGVGWRSADDYLSSKYMLNNAEQPKTSAERSLVCAMAVQLVGTGYDWEAIAADAADDLHFDWAPTWHGQVPGHVVCSSLACYAYDRAKLPRPPGDPRVDQPANWDTWILTRGWA